MKEKLRRIARILEYTAYALAMVLVILIMSTTFFPASRVFTMPLLMAIVDVMKWGVIVCAPIVLFAYMPASRAVRKGGK